MIKINSLAKPVQDIPLPFNWKPVKVAKSSSNLVKVALATLLLSSLAKANSNWESALSRVNLLTEATCGESFSINPHICTFLQNQRIEFACGTPSSGVFYQKYDDKQEMIKCANLGVVNGTFNEKGRFDFAHDLVAIKALFDILNKELTALNKAIIIDHAKLLAKGSCQIDFPINYNNCKFVSKPVMELDCQIEASQILYRKFDDSRELMNCTALNAEDLLKGKVTLMTDIFEGFFNKNGRLEGQGAATFSYQPQKRTGEFKDGLLHGQGTVFKSDGTVVYKGSWREDRTHGQGTFFRGDGGVAYTGEWSEGKRHGQGTEFFSDSPYSYKGEWQKGQKNGQGTLYHRKTKLYEGLWKNGLFHGLGTLFHPNGTVDYKGYFHNGEKVGILWQLFYKTIGVVYERF